MRNSSCCFDLFSPHPRQGHTGVSLTITHNATDGLFGCGSRAAMPIFVPVLPARQPLSSVCRCLRGARQVAHAFPAFWGLIEECSSRRLYTLFRAPHTMLLLLGQCTVTPSVGPLS
eukprot:2429518-Amphidinium_carterae.3